MSWEPYRFCITHQARADYWYAEQEWCFIGSELVSYGKWRAGVDACEVVTVIPEPVGVAESETP